MFFVKYPIAKQAFLPCVNDSFSFTAICIIHILYTLLYIVWRKLRDGNIIVNKRIRYSPNGMLQWQKLCVSVWIDDCCAHFAMDSTLRVMRPVSWEIEVKKSDWIHLKHLDTLTWIWNAKKWFLQWLCA